MLVGCKETVARIFVSSEILWSTEVVMHIASLILNNSVLEIGYTRFVSKVLTGSTGLILAQCAITVFFHSQCATRNDVWGGIELEGIPEEPGNIMSFKEVCDNIINHFSHEKHNLKLNQDGATHGGSIRCEACMLSVYSDTVY
ncbi:hypothetical protein V5N11_020018 [Cardamine amara subsp. amara]|uniref:Uncharacterized protein n=1 Tax=Cardamine amara subsp. amara TaxID=228776 RepID=A0ABD0ZU55_CARAN